MKIPSAKKILTAERIRKRMNRTESNGRLRISLLVLCHNQEEYIEASIESSLAQSRRFDEIIFIDDSSTDRTQEILQRHTGSVVVHKTPAYTGSRSGAQEYGLQFVTGSILITADPESLIRENFAAEVEKSFSNPRIMSAARVRRKTAEAAAPLKISLLVPCYNEEKSIEATILSCLNQTRRFDEIIFINDSSTDGTQDILDRYSGRILHYKTPKNTGNKSSAQEFGLQFVTGDVMVTTDGDTLIDKEFVAEIEKTFQDPEIVALAGRIQSIPYNWLTLCRAYDYVIGQGIHKLAQNYLNYIFVMPGAASAFRVKAFKENITFDHDTITEDLDFTYKLHYKQLRIVYNPRAISYTQDPANLKNYINQMRRWFGGGWQNLVKHYAIIPTSPIRAFELSLLYSEGMVFSVLMFLIPLLNLWFGLWLMLGYFIVLVIFAIWAAIIEKRALLILAPFPYMFLVFINAYIYLEQFIKEVILRKKNLIWFKPDRLDLKN